MSVCAEGADTRSGHEANAQRQTEAMIPPRTHAQLRRATPPGGRACNALVYRVRRLSIAGWKQASGSYQRPRIEAKMHCSKRLGERLRAKDFHRQITEVQRRAVILNRFTPLALGDSPFMQHKLL